MNCPGGDTAATLLDTVAEGKLGAAAAAGGGRQGVVVVVGMMVVFVVDKLIVAEQVRVGVRRWTSGVGNKKKKVVAVAVVVLVAVDVVVVVAGEIEIEIGNENVNVNVNENKSAAVGVDGGAKNEASMRSSLHLEVGKKSSWRRPGQLGSGQRQTGQNMNKNASDFGRRPGCGTS